MKKIITAFLIVLSTSLPGQEVVTALRHRTSVAGTWTLIQHPNNFTCGTTGTGSTQILSCTVTVSPTTAGDLGILLSSTIFGAATVAPTFSSASGDSSWTHCPAQYSLYNGSTYYMASDCAYIPSLSGGATSLNFAWSGTVTSGNGMASDVEFLELHRVSGTAAFDTCTSGSGCISTAAGTASRVSPSCALTSGVSDYVVQWIAETDAIVSISNAAYTNPFDLDNSDVEAGFAGALNQATAPSVTWTTSGDTSTSGASMSCVAFR